MKDYCRHIYVYSSPSTRYLLTTQIVSLNKYSRLFGSVLTRKNMANKRITKRAEKFGAVLDFSNSDLDEEDPYEGDDSFADENYSSEKSQSQDQLNLLDFDSEFDKINSPQPRATETEPVRVIVDHSSHSSPESPSPFEAKVLNQLEILTNFSKEILLRYKVIEDSLIKSGSLTSIKASKLNQNDEFNWFIKSKKMPFVTVEAFQAFEDSLDEKSMQNAVSQYIVVSNGCFFPAYNLKNHSSFITDERFSTCSKAEFVIGR